MLHPDEKERSRSPNHGRFSWKISAGLLYCHTYQEQGLRIAGVRLAKFVDFRADYCFDYVILVV